MEELQKDKEGACPTGRDEDGSSPGSLLWRILLVGLSGSGKSATGNSILCRPAFQAKLGAQPVTRACQGETGTWNGRHILVVDTPAIFESKAQEIVQDIGDCYRLCAPGPHVLLLVTNLGRYTAQHTMAVRRVKEIFRAGALKHMIVLFTHKEDLGDESLDDYVAHTDNQSLQYLVQECGRRYCGFNNRATGEEQRGQLEQLMAVVERLVQERKGSFYSNDLFLQAQALHEGGRENSPEDYNHYLVQVRQWVGKQKEEEGSWLPTMLLRGRNWMALHYEICVGCVWCILFLSLILVLILLHV